MNAPIKFASYRKIEPLLINLSELNYTTVQDFNPDFRMIDPSTLSVDEKYQRNVSRKSMKLIKKIIAEWSWSAFKPPIVTEYEDGTLYVLDGQHTSIAAATHPNIATIPVFVVKTFDIKDRADAFIRHNVDRTKVSDIALFKARLEAGDETAISVNMALTRSKVTLTSTANLKTNGSAGIGECSCVKTLEEVFNRRGLMKLRQILDICVAAKLSPIQAHYVVALDMILSGNDRDKFDHDGLAVTIRDYPYAQLSADIEYRSKKYGDIKKTVATNLIKEAYNKKFV